jgi:hypothetical protein
MTCQGLSLSIAMRPCKGWSSAGTRTTAWCRCMTSTTSGFAGCYCGNPERHEYELYLAIDEVDHSRTRTKRPQTTDPAHE